VRRCQYMGDTLSKSGFRRNPCKASLVCVYLAAGWVLQILDVLASGAAPHVTRVMLDNMTRRDVSCAGGVDVSLLKLAVAKVGHQCDRASCLGDQSAVTVIDVVSAGSRRSKNSMSAMQAAYGVLQLTMRARLAAACPSSNCFVCCGRRICAVVIRQLTTLNRYSCCHWCNSSSSTLGKPADILDPCIKSLVVLLCHADSWAGADRGERERHARERGRDCIIRGGLYQCRRADAQREGT
jgi:hypothetical protein